MHKQDFPCLITPKSLVSKLIFFIGGGVGGLYLNVMLFQQIGKHTVNYVSHCENYCHQIYTWKNTTTKKFMYNYRTSVIPELSFNFHRAEPHSKKS